MIDRESLFHMLAKKEWDELAKVMYRNSKLIGSDPVFQQAVRLFESEFFSETAGLTSKERIKIFEYPGLIIDTGRHAFSPEFVARFIDEKLVLFREERPDALLSFAAANQHRPLAKEIIREIQANEPEQISDAKRENLTVRATAQKPGKSLTIGLFKSRQEQNFFEAVREAFPTYHPYPNVAVSCILDFAGIKSSLSQAEREYFFKAIVDCVVFDASSGYEPRYFFELDSVFHGSERAVANDHMKDGIFSAANVKLIRIRAYSMEEVTVQNLKSLVLEVMRGL